MRQRAEITAFVFFLIFLITAPFVNLWAQEAVGEFEGETTVNVVEIPVRVVDKKTGEPVLNLEASDFVIKENGSVQAITNFSEISSIAPPTPNEGAIEEKPSASVATVERSVEIIYFFDLYLMEKRDKRLAIDALRQRYHSSAPDNQKTSIVTFDGTMLVHVDRSGDNFDVLDGLDEVEDIRAHGIEQYLGFTEALSPAEPSGERDQNFYERRQRSNEYFYEMEKRVKRVGTALSATMARFAIADGRRVLVAMTPGFPGSNWAPSYSPIDFLNSSARYPAIDLWRDVALEAADLGFTLYVVDSSGLRTSTAGDAERGVTDQIAESFAQGELFGGENTLRRADINDDEPGVNDVDPNAGPRELGGWIERTRKNLLVSAAATTGGSAIFDDDVEKAFSEVTDALGHYYSLAYQAEHIGDSGEYSIQVELPKHPDLILTHRTSYIDLPPSTRRAQRLRSAMLFGRDANPLGIRVETGEAESHFKLGAAKSKRVSIPFHLRIPFARIEMIDHGETYEGSLLITFFGEDANGNQSELAHFEQAVSLADDDYEEAVSRGFFSYKATVEIEGGAQRVYVGVNDTISGRTSIMPQEFDF